MLGPQNAQDFIRALKASSDPPHVGGPLKIDIATDAWENTHLYVPNKAEAIIEWVLTRLLKDKSRDRAANPLCDSRYWRLLSKVLTTSGSTLHGYHGRALRAWLVPLLNRVPIAPILLSYFEIISNEGSFDSAQYKLVAQCVAVLWPLAVPKFSPETLLECFGAAARLVVALGGPEESTGHLQELDGHRALSLIVSSYRAALSTSGSKRKQLYTLFLQKHLNAWLQVATRCCDGEGAGGQPQLVSDFYDAGIDTLFGLDILRPAADQKHESALADALERTLKILPGAVLRTLPRLFTSYVHTVKRYKGALFGQGSSQTPGHTAEQLQVTAMAFYAGCNALTRNGEDDLFWQCRVALLEVIEKENLFNSKDDNAKALLRRDGEIAVDALAIAWDETHSQRTDSAVKILASLTRIDYDLMSASSAVVLPRLAASPAAATAVLQYLGLLLEYDSKTRNLPTFIMHLAEAFSAQHLQRIPDGPRAAYELASAGPLTNLAFFDELARAVHSFLTPGQVLETIGDVSRTLKEAYDLFLEREAKLSADRGDGPRKKRKKDASIASDRTEPEYHAVSFALVARTMAVVLRSLPMHMLPEDVRAESQEAVRDLYTSVAIRALVDGQRPGDRRDVWHWQVVVTGALRLHYGLVGVSGLQQHLRLDHVLLSSMLSCASSGGTTPELAVEMFRTLLHQCTLDTLQPATVLDKLLAYLEAHAPGRETSWAGKTHTLKTDIEAALAMLHLLVDRWLPYFDAWSTPEHRKRFARILMNVGVDDAATQPRSSMTMSAVISRMLHDAEFWELLNIREAFLAQLSEQTAALDEFRLHELLSSPASYATSRNRDGILGFTSAYDILLLTPPEYLSRPLQIALLKRGLIADVLVFKALRDPASSTVSARHLLVIREFLRRTIAYLGNVDVVTQDFLNYLVEHASVDDQIGSAADQGLDAVAMELIDMYQGTLVRAAKRGSTEAVTDLANRYAQSYAIGGADTGRKPSLLLVDSFVREGSVADFSEPIVRALRSLYKQMLAFGTTQLPSSSNGFPTPLDLDLLNTWSHMQTLGRWLQEEAEGLPPIGRSLCSKLLSWKDDKQQAISLAPVVLAILLGEAQTAAHDERVERLQFVVVAYLSLTRLCGRQGVAPFESRLGIACRTFSPEDFAALLELVYEGLLLQNGLSGQDIANLIRFSAVVLHDAPEGTSKICQSFTTRALNLFADNERFTTTPDLRREVVDFLVRQCNDKPASFRTADLSSLWSLLRALLTPSPAHEQNTDAATFDGIINVLSALVRLRRDLVLHTLPHLGFALRQLVSSLRALRPQLGGKQRRLVLDTLPRWIAPAQPLGVPESKALARLLTTLTTKTIVRVHGPAADAQKPEALARPFSKHAAYVLTAYVEAVNDPLCAVGAAVRRELQPGLFALCDMLGEHNRDAMMVSALDAGGKATMKALWQEYEKQRYVGKG